MGHKNIKTTQIYAKITNEKISKDMEIAAERLRIKDRIASQCLLKIRNPLIIFQKEMCQMDFFVALQKAISQR